MVPLSTPPLPILQTTVTPASPPSSARPYSPVPFPQSSSNSRPGSRPTSPTFDHDDPPRARTTSALALMHAGLGLLSLPPTPGLEEMATQGGRDGELEWGQAVEHMPRSPVLSFVLPAEGANRREDIGGAIGSGKISAGDSANGGGERVSAPPPTTRKTSGPRAFLRRAKSFGTSPLLGSTSFFSSSPSTSNAPTPSTSSSHLPPSPPLPSPPLPRQATTASPRPSTSTATVKGKECARTTAADAPHWLSTAAPLSPTPGASFSSLHPSGNEPTRRTDEGPRKVTRPVRRSTFSLFKRNDPTPSPAPVAPPSADTTPASSFDLPRSSSPQPISNLPSLPSLHLSSSYRMSWGFGSSSSSPSLAASPTPSNRSRSRRPHSSNGRPSTDSNTDGSQLVSSPSEEQVGLGFELGGATVARTPSTRVGRSHSDVGRPSSTATGAGSFPRSQSTATSPLRAPTPTSGGFFSPSPSSEKDLCRPPSRPSLSRRPSTSGGVLNAVSGFFSGGSGSSGSSMARSGSGGAEANEFGTLFEEKGRKRGMSVGNGIFAGSDARKRAGSSSSLSHSWVPPSGSGSLLVPTDAGGGTSSTGTTGRSRASTEGRRFSFSSNASSQSSLLPPMPSPHFLEPGGTPPGSPTMTRKSSELGLRDSSGSRKVSLSVGTRTRAPSILSLKIEEDELPEVYVERLVEVVKKSEIARILASSSDAFHVTALAHYLSSFDFHGDPLDIALRKFLMEASLPPEAQQIDRTMEAFAIQYNLCNPGLFASSDTPYVLAFSLVMLSTDQFNPSNKNKMNKVDYCKNTKIDGVSNEVLEYFFDQITITPFVFVEDDVDINGLAKLDLPTTSSFFSTKSGGQKEKSKLDPYHLIARGLTHDLRVDIESIIPFKSPFSFTGTTSFFNATTLHHAFARAPILQITARPRSKSSATEGAPLAPATSITTFAPPAEKGAVSSLKITKIGLLSRKEDLVEGGKKAASRKWKGWSVILTGSQLLFFKDPGWAETLHKAVGAALAAETAAAEDHHVVVFPPVAAFKPDAVLSLANSAAIYDSTYSKYNHVFRLVAPAGRQYLFQARDEDDLNSWLAHINYAASFKSAGLRMRGLTPKRQSLSHIHPGLPVPRSPVPFSPTVPHTSFASSSSATDSTRDDTLPLFDPPPQPLSPVTEEEGALPPGLQEALRAGVMETPRPRGENGEYSFPRTFSGEMKQGDVEALSRQPATRAHMLRTKIGELETQIRAAKSSLHTDLRMARNLAVLTPFLRSTRDRILAAAVPIEKRVRHARMNLAKLVCHREVLARDLLVEDREAQRSRKVSSHNRHPSNPPSSPLRTPRPNDSPWPPPAFSQPPTRLAEPLADDDAERESFDSGVDDYAGALTDDELDRLRAAPPMQRSTTETPSSGRFRSNTASEDELPPTSIHRSPSPSLSHPKSPRPSTSLASLAPSGDLGSELSEDVPLASPFPTTTELPEEEEEAEQWANTRAAKRVSLIAYETLDGPGVSSLIKIRERRVEGGGEE